MKTPEEKRFRFNLVTLTWENTPVGKRPLCCNSTRCGGNFCYFIPGGSGAELPPGASKQLPKQLDEQARAQGYSHFGEAVVYAHQQRRDNHALDSMIYSVAASPFYLGKVMGFHAFCDPTLGVPFEWKKPNFIFVDEADIPTEAGDLADLQRLELEANTTRAKIRAIHDRRKSRAAEARRQEAERQRQLQPEGPTPELLKFMREVLADIADNVGVSRFYNFYPYDFLVELSGLPKVEHLTPILGADVQGDRIAFTFCMSPTGV